MPTIRSLSPVLTEAISSNPISQSVRMQDKNYRTFCVGTGSYPSVSFRGYRGSAGIRKPHSPIMPDDSTQGTNRFSQPTRFLCTRPKHYKAGMSNLHGQTFCWPSSSRPGYFGLWQPGETAKICTFEEAFKALQSKVSSKTETRNRSLTICTSTAQSGLFEVRISGGMGESYVVTTPEDQNFALSLLVHNHQSGDNDPVQNQVTHEGVTPPPLPPKIKSTVPKLHQALQRVAEQVKASSSGLPDSDARTALARDRFSNIKPNATTHIGYGLNGNNVAVNGQPIAKATQYPMWHQMENQLRMLAETKATALVVLASASEIADKSNQMNDYFSRDGHFGSIRTTSIKKGEPVSLGKQVNQYTSAVFELKTQQYDLTIKGTENCITVPVIHVLNWPDHKSISTESALILAKLIEKTLGYGKDKYQQQNLAMPTDSTQGLPVYHCRAGVGRTGLMIGLRGLLTTSASAFEIGKGMRETRNPRMLQTEEQIRTFAEAAAALGKSII